MAAPAAQRPGQRPDLPWQVAADVDGRVPLAAPSAARSTVAVAVAEQMRGRREQVRAGPAAMEERYVMPGIDRGLRDVLADERWCRP